MPTMASPIHWRRPVRFNVKRVSGNTGDELVALPKALFERFVPIEPASGDIETPDGRVDIWR